MIIITPPDQLMMRFAGSLSRKGPFSSLVAVRFLSHGFGMALALRDCAEVSPTNSHPPGITSQIGKLCQTKI
jgi:hypothetical protein